MFGKNKEMLNGLTTIRAQAKRVDDNMKNLSMNLVIYLCRYGKINIRR